MLMAGVPLIRHFFWSEIQAIFGWEITYNLPPLGHISSRQQFASQETTKDHLRTRLRWERLLVHHVRSLRSMIGAWEAHRGSPGPLLTWHFEEKSSVFYLICRDPPQKVKKIIKNPKFQNIRNIFTIPFRRVELTVRSRHPQHMKSFPLVNFSNGGSGYSGTQCSKPFRKIVGQQIFAPLFVKACL